MKKILLKSKISDVYSLLKLILVVLQNAVIADDSYLINLTGRLVTALKNYIKAINESRLKSMVMPIDQRRDTMIRSFFMELKSKLLSLKDDVRQNAQTIQEAIKNYSISMVNLPYSEETTQLDAMLSDLEKPEVQLALTNLTDLNDIVQMLKTIQAEFTTAADAYNKAIIDGESVLPAYKQCRIIISTLNNELLPYLYTMSNVNPAVYGDIYTQIASHIDQNNARVHNRKPSDVETPEELPVTEN